ncbi:MAG: tetratricopeptide repeat protein [Chlorobi bacterium]|nr:tetratricopeptide repeat protein [Chlorobiota bacterium]
MKKHSVRLLALCCIALGACAGLMRLTPDHARARQFMQRSQWDSARVLLEREIQRNPQNFEAWYDLGAVRKELGDVPGMLDAYRRAEPGLSDERRRALPQIFYVAWAEFYNTSVELYNRMVESRDTADLGRALGTIANAITIRPEAPENYDLQGRLYELRGDTASALAAYERYAEALSPAIDLARRAGLSLGMSRDAVVEKFGAPQQSRPSRTTTGDSMIVDRFVWRGDTIYVSSYAKQQQGYRVEGWRLRLPASWSLDERFRYAPISIGPLIQLATIHYNRRQFDKALAALEPLSVLTPSDETVQNFRIQIYRDQGKLDKALAELKQLVERDPNNKSYIASYALVLLQMEQYDDAIAEYEKALQLDPQYDVALFNAAAALKNRAAQIQKEERDRKERDPKYKENEQRYFPLLIKAADYFDRYRQLPEHRNDLTALEHMLNIYETIREKDKLRKLVVELEAMEPQFASEPRYYELLGGYYARNNQVDKAERYFKRADQLRKQR